MRNLLISLLTGLLIISTVGCANGPLKRWLRGAPCNTCNPAINQSLSGNFVGGCNDGTCGAGTCNTGNCSTGAVGNGILGGLFRGNNQSVAQSNGANGALGGFFQQGSQTTNQPPISLPASSFADAPPATLGSSAELYGNTNTTGQLELPPNIPFN